ncbi:MAG: biotin--[acetyl-CoA-carboxylase] ligase [Gammaproteobacteria bacterium]
MKSKQLPSNMVRLIRLLADTKFHTGNELGEHLNVSRTAIWKQIKQLENLGVKIDKSQVNGYKFSKPMVLIEKKQISTFLNSKEMQKACHFKILSTVTSTNDYLKSRKNTNEFDFCIAEQQTEGRGRFNRAWFSPFAENIYLSCSWQLHCDVSELSGISLIIGMIVIDTLHAYGLDVPFKVKWPNDVYYNKQKVAGSL